jgi:endonuclease G
MTNKIKLIEKLLPNKYKKNPIWISLTILIGFILYQCTDTTVQPNLPESKEQHIYAGLPIATNYPNPIKRIDRTGYVIAYDEQRKNPAWVAYHLTAIEKKPTSKRPSRFKTDKDTEAKVSHKDYTNSGYDRGHMAPNYGISTRYGRAAQIETFLMSNIVPQKPNLNRGVWRKLEMKVAKLANRFDGVYIITGPIYDNQIETISKKNIEIPDSFYKIIIDLENNTPRALAFIMPQNVNRKDKPEKFLTNIDEIEKQTGLDFFADLEDSYESQFEHQIAKQIW